MKHLILIFCIIGFSNCTSNINQTNTILPQTTVLKNTNTEKNEDTLKQRLPRFTPIDFNYFYGQWVLTDFFDAAKAQHRFWTVPNYPNNHNIQIEILDTKVIFSGYHESGSYPFEWTEPLRLQVGYWKEKGDHYFLLDVDTVANSLNYTFMEVGEEQDIEKEKYVFHRMPEHDIFDVPNFLQPETLGQIIKENWLLGTYIDLNTNDTIEITNNMIADIPCILETDYEAIGSSLDILKITDEAFIQDRNYWLGYRWEKDILYIHHMNHNYTEGGLGLSKGDIYRTFKRVE